MGLHGSRPETTAVHLRASAMGLTVWLVEPDGSVLAVDENDLVGRLCRCEVIAEAIRRAAGEALDGGVAMVEPMAGLRLVGVQLSTPMEPRVVALAPSDAMPGASWLEGACAEAGLDRGTVAAELGSRLISDAEADRLQVTLRFLREDDAMRYDAEQLNASFSDELTTSYETLDLLYSISRTMSDAGRPDDFVTKVLEEMRTALMFAWAGAMFTKEAGPELQRQSFVAGDLGVATSWFRGELRPESVDQAEPAMRARNAEFARFLGPRGAVQPIVSGSRKLGLLVVGGRESERHITSYELQAIRATAQHIAAYVEIALLYAEQRDAFFGTLRSLTAAIDAKDAYTRGHSERVARLAAMTALRMGLPQADADRLETAGLVHDVGKIGIPESILCKPGALTNEEFDVIKRHPDIGHRILQGITPLKAMLPAVLHHHERWDGGGYPHGLSGEKIPLDARILAVCDTFDAMSSNRSYRPAMDRAKVISEIKKNAGAQFDPAIVPAFLQVNFGAYDDLVEEAARRALSEGPARSAA